MNGTDNISIKKRGRPPKIHVININNNNDIIMPKQKKNNDYTNIKSYSLLNTIRTTPPVIHTHNHNHNHNHNHVPQTETVHNKQCLYKPKLSNNIIIQLKLSKDIIKDIENNMLFKTSLYTETSIFEQNNIEPKSISSPMDYMYDSKPANIIQQPALNVIQPLPNKIPVNNIKLSHTLKPLDAKKLAETTKNLLLNSGTNYKIHKIMSEFHEKKEWPATSSYCCWYDCHPFNETPVGIPEKIIIENGNITFELSGNFCSYNCAYRYLNPCLNNTDDISLININLDYIYADDKSNKTQLLELLCSIECNHQYLNKIKPSAPRLSLKLFGGLLSIEDYRANFNQHTEFHIFKYPLVPIIYNIGELTKPDNQSKIDYSSVEAICKIWEDKCQRNHNHT